MRGSSSRSLSRVHSPYHHRRAGDLSTDETIGSRPEQVQAASRPAAPEKMNVLSRRRETFIFSFPQAEKGAFSREAWIQRTGYLPRAPGRLGAGSKDPSTGRNAGAARLIGARLIGTTRRSGSRSSTRPGRRGSSGPDRPPGRSSPESRRCSAPAGKRRRRTCCGWCSPAPRTCD